jgi:hypothetical protein
MAWNFYGLDQKAQNLVLDAKKRDLQSLNQAHKMRQSVAYGLERFWGEHLRLISSNNEGERNKGRYWKATWETLAEIMANAGIIIPNESINGNEAQQIEQIKTMSRKLWGEIPVIQNGQRFGIEDQRVTLAVLTQLTESLVWWTQRYK